MSAGAGTTPRDKGGALNAWQNRGFVIVHDVSASWVLGRRVLPHVGCIHSFSASAPGDSCNPDCNAPSAVVPRPRDYGGQADWVVVHRGEFPLVAGDHGVAGVCFGVVY
jgi:hypothetical protein